MDFNVKGELIKNQINSINEEIARSLKPNVFVLNNTVLELTNKIQNLQKACPHNFDEDGFCIYCNLMKE